MKQMNRFIRPVFLIALFLCLCSVFVYADRIQYSYDASGNRTHSQTMTLRGGGTEESQDTARNTLREQLGGHRISVYPNPTEGQFSVEISSIETLESASITIYSITGGIVFQTDKPEARNDIDLTSCPDGMYLMVIRINGAGSTWKVIKQ